MNFALSIHVVASPTYKIQGEFESQVKVPSGLSGVSYQHAFLGYLPYIFRFS